MNSMSLSAYVFGFAASNSNNTPQPPQPDINDILPPNIEGVVSSQTNFGLLDYIERDVDVIEGEDF